MPLFAITLGITIYLANKSAIGQRLAMVMWLPVMVSLAAIPVSEYFTRRERAAYAAAHPNVREFHVNLTGRDLWFDPAVGAHPMMSGQHPDTFLSLEREPTSNRGDKMAAYQGVLLSSEFKSMPVIYGPSKNGAPATVPVVVMPTPGGWAPFLSKLGTDMAQRLTYFYYHYPDHVEVASTIQWDDGYTAQPDNGKPASGVFIQNLTGETIVRLEVNGETVPFFHGLLPQRDGDCGVKKSTAVIGVTPKLKVRWQTAESAPHWSEATPTLPAFRRPIPAGSSITSTSVHFFLRPRSDMTVQRAQTYETPSGRDHVQVSEPLPAFKTAPPCGDAADHYAPTLERSPD